jgi:hypothetical protein
MADEKRADRRRVGRPRLHPEGLTERLCVPVTREQYQSLERLSKARDVPVARLVRERLDMNY